MSKFVLPSDYRLPEHYQQPGRRVALQPGPGRIPGHVCFKLGTCEGALRCGPAAYELLAVVNKKPGNGDFQALLRHLRALARAHRRDLVVLEVKNAGLYASLQRTAGMVPVAGTLHLLLPVGGPGTCPAHLLESKAHPLLDRLLELVTRQVGELPDSCT